MPYQFLAQAQPYAAGMEGIASVSVSPVLLLLATEYLVPPVIEDQPLSMKSSLIFMPRPGPCGKLK